MALGGRRNRQQKRTVLIIQHYLQLLVHYRRLVTKIILWVTLGALALSLLLLFLAPKYTGTASVVMLPTDPELAFTKGWTGSSQYNPTAFMAQTQVEYLLSRPVAERTLQKLAREMSEQPKPTGLQAVMADAANALKYVYYWTYNMLNYGKYIPLTAYETNLNKLRRGLDIEVVEGSFVMQISVSLPSAKLAARAANAIARSYQEEIAKHFSMAGSELEKFLNEEIARREAVVDSLVNEEIELGKKLGILSIEEQKAFLQTSLDAEQAALSAAQVQLAQLETRVQSLREQAGSITKQDVLSQLDEDLAMEQVQRDVLTRGIEVRKANIADLTGRLEELAVKEEPLRKLATKRENAEAHLQDLVDRKLDVYLASYDSLKEVQEIDPAVPPKYPSSPMVLIYTILAFIAGIFMATFVLIAIDSTSETVKTFPDLFKVAGQRALALVTPAMSAQARGRPLRFLGKFDFLTNRIPDLVHRLAGRGTTPEAPVDIVAFGGPAVGLDAAVTLCAALALEGKPVVCRLPDNVEEPGIDPRLADMVTFTRDGSAGCDGGIHLRLDTAASPWDRLRGDTRQGFICAVKAGLFTEDRLAGFRDEAAAAGQDNVDFILVGD